jgi:hypothetical protein
MEGSGLRLRFMLMAVAGWWTGRQQETVAYLIEKIGAFESAAWPAPAAHR